MTSLAQRQTLLFMIDQAVAAGARTARAYQILGLSLGTVQRWKRMPCRGDQRPDRAQRPHNRFSELERQRILSVINSAEYGHLPPSQIVPRLADQGQYLTSESTMYRLLSVGQLVRHHTKLVARRRGASKFRQRASGRLRDRKIPQAGGLNTLTRDN